MIYLRGLNALRFFAAMLVVIFHCNDGLRQVNEALFHTDPIFTKGPVAVDFFFILSGFLLSYIAWQKYRKSGFLSIKDFLMRRMLRIAPLYYLAVFLGFVLIGYVFPQVQGTVYNHYDQLDILSYYLVFLPNVVIAKWQSVGPTYSLWSIGVEEQFYLLFPFLMLLGFRIKKVMAVVLLALVVYSLFYFGVYYKYISLSPMHHFLVIFTLRFHFLFFGVLLGSIYNNHPDHWFFKQLERPVLQLSILGGLIWSFFFITEITDPHNLIGGILFASLMINVTRDRSIVNLEWQPLVYLGTISYGIYIFHPFVSIAVRYVMSKINMLNGWIGYLPALFYIIVTLITIWIAHLSYRYYESYFLKMKEGFPN